MTDEWTFKDSLNFEDYVSSKISTKPIDKLDD